MSETVINVHVKKAHILEGCRKDQGNCPIALAISEQTGADSVRADLDMIQIDGLFFYTPEKARNFIDRFDFCESKQSLRSIKFRLEKPEPKAYLLRQRLKEAPDEN